MVDIPNVEQTGGSAPQASKRQQYAKRFAVLEQKRKMWDLAVRDICDHMAPYRHVLDAPGDHDRGDRRGKKIIDSTPLDAVRTSAAGLMAGMTSPAAIWYEVTVDNKEISLLPNVRRWLDMVREISSDQLQAGGFYHALANGTYPDLLTIATGLMLVEDDAQRGVTYRGLVWGQYVLDTGADGRVDTVIVRYHWSVKQVVEKFGLAVCSADVQRAYRSGETTAAREIVHAIAPNASYTEGAFSSKGKRWLSCWYDAGEPRVDHLLKESGYDEFPIMAPRWSVMPGDTYGRGPGWDALPDCKSLQVAAREYLEMLAKVTKPPMKGKGVRGQGTLIVGDFTQLDGDVGNDFAPAITIPPGAIEEARAGKEEWKQSIRTLLYARLFEYLIASRDQRQKATATEIEALREQVMLLLGPLLENLNPDLLEPVIERTINILWRQGRLPPPPQELRGAKINVEFRSIVHQMQKSTRLSGMRAFLQEVGIASQMDTEALDNLDTDAYLEEMALITGVPAKVVRSAEEKAKRRQAREQALAEQKQSQDVLAATEGVKNIGSVPPETLQNITQGLSQAAAAQAGVRR